MKKNTNIYRGSGARGFSLVELMVALLIGLIISIGVVQIFGATRATYQLDEALARAQENGRFALEFLTHDIRHAGYLGCSRDTTVIPFNYLANPPGIKIPIKGVSAFEYTAIATGIGDAYTTPSTTPNNTVVGWSGALTTTILGRLDGALPGTDVVAIQRMVPAWRLVPPFVTATNVFIDPAVAGRVRLNDVLMVADCRQAAVFMVTDVNLTTGAIGHTAGPATNRCASWTDLGPNDPAAQCTSTFDNPVPGTVLGTLETIVFFVAKDTASGQPTLYKNVLNPTGAATVAQALVEGVENLQVLYGVDDVGTPEGADRYVPANGAGDFSRVVSIQIGILVYGVNATGTANDTEIETAATDTQIVAGTNILPPVSGSDTRKKRRVFNTTIQLRNRGT